MRIYECGEPEPALRELVRALGGPEARRRAWWLGAAGEVRAAFPAGSEPPAEVVRAAAAGRAAPPGEA
ncbi:MAG: hypothetical protein ICV87_05740, partial [Gemmatimonadetes bacterium]|nr:hypothetical protein [Gemmatimonadota bacterium]